MKQSTKRLLSLLLSLALVLAMLPMGVFAFAEETTTIYFDSSVKGWSNVNAYYWNDTENNGWPGTAMTLVEGTIWSIEVPTDAVNIIFNNGSAQTSNLKVPTDGKNLHNGASWSTYGGDDAEEVTFDTVYVDLAAAGWSTVNAYIWNASGAPVNGPWPGSPMTLVEGNIYSVKVLTGEAANVIFNNGSGTKTSDLAWPGDGYIWNGTEFVDYATYIPSDEEFVLTYYVVGDLNSWTASDEYALTANEDGTYSLEVAVVAGQQELKVNSNEGAWYPAGDNVIINPTTDGTVIVTLDPVAGTVVVTGDCLGEVVIPDPEYYLFGYINEANYGCEDDAANLGEYHFVDGTLVATFETDSYVAVKTTNNDWYMTEGFDASLTSVTLYNTEIGLEDANKLYVPGGVEVTFTLVVNEDDTLTLTADYEAPEIPSEDPEDPSDDPSEDSSESVDPVETITVYVDGAACGWYGDVYAYYWGGSYGPVWPGEVMEYVDGFVYSVTIPVDTLNIIFNNNNGSQTGELVPVADNIWNGTEWVEYASYEAVAPAFYLAADWNSWAFEDYALMQLGDVYYIGGISLAAGTYEFKISNGTWDVTWPGDNYVLEVPADSSNISITFTPSTGAIEVSGVEQPAVDPDAPVLVLGDNAYDLPAGSQDGMTGVFTATEDGILSITVTAMSTMYQDFETGEEIWEDVPAEYISMQFMRSFALEANGTGIFGGAGTIEVSAGDIISIKMYSYMGNAAKATVNLTYLEEIPAEDYNVYFDNTIKGWETVYAYAWNADGTVSDAWPGTEMTLYDGNVYSTVLSNAATNIIFNNGGSYQTADLAFPEDTNMCFDGYNSTLFGADLGTIFTVAGDAGLTGAEWDTTTNVMTNLGGGIFSITFDKVAAATYGFKVTNGTWDVAWPGENYVLEVAAYGSVTINFNVNTNEITVETVATPATAPTIQLKYPSLTFESEVYMNLYCVVSNGDDIAEIGMIMSDDNVAEATDLLVNEYEATVSGTYTVVRSHGIPAKQLGESKYIGVYAKLVDGTYVFTKLNPYSALAYAKDRLVNSSNVEMKQLCVAMMNYAAAAQNHMNYNTDNLANSTLTAEQLGLIDAYRADMVAAVGAVDSAKNGIFARSGFGKCYPSVSFEGAFAISYYFTPSYAPENGMKLYYWSIEDYNAADVLTKENATGVVEMSANGSAYKGDVTGIAAKELDKTYYVSGVYEYNGTTYATGVLPYSLGAYCLDRIANGSESMKALAEATAVYGYYAKQYFDGV